MASAPSKAQVEFFSGAPRKVLEFPTPSSRTALHWHRLRTEASARGLPIECGGCQKPHETPPPLGRCACGSYLFTVGGPTRGQLALQLEAVALDLHGGEQ